MPVRECADEAGAPPDLTQDAFKRVVGADTPPRSAACARSGRPGYLGGPRCVRSVAHCTADLPQHPARRSTSPPPFQEPSRRDGLVRSTFFDQLLLRFSTIAESLSEPWRLHTRSSLLSPCCHSAWHPNPSRSSTYRYGKSAQTTGTTSVCLPIPSIRAGGASRDRGY